MSDSFKLRVMTYNLHMYGNANDLAGIDIGGLEYYDRRRLTEFIKNVEKEEPLPDVIGLNEVWDEKLIEYIYGELRDLYPFMVKGSINSAGITYPDIEGELEWLGLSVLGTYDIVQGVIRWIGAALGSSNLIGSGLMLLSRHPIISHKFVPYSSEAGFDAYAEKGVLAAKIQVPDIAATVGVLLTHLQADSDEADVRRGQLSELASVAAHLRLSSPRMALITMGDFNVIGEDSYGQQTNEYTRMIEQLGLTDTWRVQHPEDPGVTYDGRNNDLSKQFDEDDTSQERLDYIFYDPDPSYYVDCELTLCKLLKYQSTEGVGSENVRDLSDHYGLLAEYSVEVRPFGTITYHVDAHPDMPDIETPALRSLLAWMEKAAIGYARVDPADETPIIRVGFARENDFRNGSPVIEWLGRVHLNPQPLLNGHGDPWLWGLGYDPQARQLDLAYALQHFIGLALHSVSPRANSVEAPLDEQNSVPGSVMLPYQPEREFVDSNDQTDPNHLNHLTNSDIEYITALYGRRTELFDWRDKVQALLNNDLIKTILESGLTGTNGLIEQNISHIDRQIAEVQAEIPIDAKVYIHKLVWCGGISDAGIYEDEEIRFKLIAFDGMYYDKPYYYPSRDGYHEIKCEEPSVVHVPPNPLVIHSVTSNLSMTLEVTEVDGFLQGCDKPYPTREIKLPKCDLLTAFEELRSPNGSTSITIPLPTTETRYDGKWWANVELVFYPREDSGWRSDKAASLKTQRIEQQETHNRLHKSFGNDLVVAVENQLDKIWGDLS